MNQVKTKKTWFLQTSHSCFNTQTANHVYLCFSTIDWLLQFLIDFVWVVEARSKLIQLSQIFCILIYQFAPAQQSSTVKLPAFFFRFQTEEHALTVNKSEITGQNAFHGDIFEIEDNHEGSKDEKTEFQAFLQNCYLYFNPQTVKYVYLRFSSIVWIFQFLSHFLRVLEARSKLTHFQTTL